MTERIPGPSGLPFVGNMFDVQSDQGYLKATETLADVYGPIYQMTLSGQRVITISSPDLMLEVLDDKNWVTVPLDELSRGEEAKGMFNAPHGHPDWGQSRRILAPSFGPLAIEGMYEGMRDIANQMIMRWARMGDGHRVLLTDDFTRFTLDTIALCTMDYRFNSFYKDELHPFVDAMVTYLTNSLEVSNRPWIVNMLLPNMRKDKQRAKKLLDEVAQKIIDERRATPKAGDDLVNKMLFAKDPKTGQVMRDSLIRESMIAFLIAGHETTSSLLSFAFGNMIRHPQAYLEAREEVARVVGSGRVEVNHVKKLKFVSAVLRETLRLTPTVSSLARRVHPDRNGEGIVIGGGKYYISPEDQVEIILTKVQKDPSLFGDDAHMFKPERMMDDNSRYSDFMKVWKPFGAGSRACIGQSFAWQEAVMAVAMILQNFDMNFSDPGYQMKIQEVLTIKPDNLWVDVRLREGLTPAIVEKRLSSRDGPEPEQLSDHVPAIDTMSVSTPKLMVLFGSNTGSCQALAQKVAAKIATAFKIPVVARDLDSVAEGPLICPIIVITATYEGEPPDNAGRFVAWLESSEANAFSGIGFAVFGLGNKNWQATYQRIPRLIDSTFETKGGKRLAPFKGIDVTECDMIEELEAWDEHSLRKALQGLFGEQTKDFQTVQPDAHISTNQRATSISNGMVLGKVVRTEVLTRKDQPKKRHIEIELPRETRYNCGDYLAILPLNGQDLVRRIMAHWQLPFDSTIVLKSASFAPLLLDVPIAIFELLTGYFELSQLPSKKTLQACVALTANTDTRTKMNALVADAQAYDNVVRNNQMSLFDILAEHKDIQMSFASFLSSLVPLRPRQYSISSSPLTSPNTCTLTYGVLRGQPTDGRPSFEGVASNYLASLKPGDTLQVSVRLTATANKACPFRLPTDPKSTPVLMIGAGTGLAPFRGFIQERAAMIELNPDLKRELAPAVLFMGCRSATEDRLYAAEMDHWISTGVVQVHYAFSREPDASKGCKYVSDRIYAEKEQLSEMWERGARLYLCGSRALLESVETTFIRILEESVGTEDQEKLEEEKRVFYDECSQRAVSDVFD